MSYRNSLIICRLLVALLLFNFAAPMAMANSNASNTALLCTSAGLITINLADLSEAKSDSQTHLAEHCPFCFFNDLEPLIGADHLSYPTPDTQIALLYQSISPLSPSKAITKHALMRAPPFTL